MPHGKSRSSDARFSSFPGSIPTGLNSFSIPREPRCERTFNRSTATAMADRERMAPTI